MLSSLDYYDHRCTDVDFWKGEKMREKWRTQNNGIKTSCILGINGMNERWKKSMN